MCFSAKFGILSIRLIGSNGSLPHQSGNFCISNSIEAKLKLCARASKLSRITAGSIDLLVCTVCLGFF